MQTKRCSCCHQTKPLDEFGIRKTSSDGRVSHCNECRRSKVHGFVSLYASVRNTENLFVIDTLSLPKKSSDKTYSKVSNALWSWVRNKIISEAQAQVIFLHAVEGWLFVDIAQTYKKHHTTIMHHYRTGIEKLRQAFSGMEMEVLNYVRTNETICSVA